MTNSLFIVYVKQKLLNLHSILIIIYKCQFVTVREKRPGPAADIYPGGALGATGLGEHRVHQRTRLPAPPTGQGQGRHEVLQECHEDQ